ncbi:MAG: hypothetical protein FGM32_02585 [Candidatus Kapabacteria bacterium]|nr:hypothetical protein [Candidatus Kapabacteria bacterium]
MTNQLHERCQQSIAEHGALVLSEQELAEMSQEDAEDVRQTFGAQTLLKLPEHEIAFFEWLRQADAPVWSDLWGDAEQAPYLVSLAFLKDFVGTSGKGAFHICDLQTQDNYFFTPDMLLEKESTDFVNAVRERFLGGENLTVEQALTVEISAGPVDIWHFAFLRGVDLQRAKRAVASLVEDRIIVHVPSADHLSTYFDVG